MTQADSVVYSARARRRLRWAATGLIAAAGAWSSAAGVCLIHIAHVAPRLHLYILLAVAIAAVLSLLLAIPRAPLIGNAGLRRRIAEKIGRQPGGAQFLENAHFVGLAPTAELVLWDGDSDWDVGFAKPVGDTLVFWGDRSRCSLPRTAIWAIDVVDRPDVSRVIIRWSAGDLSGVIALTSREGHTTGEARRNAAALVSHLTSWWQHSNGAPGPAWGWPPTEEEVPGGRPPGQTAPIACLGALAAIAITVTSSLLVAAPAYAAGLKALAVMHAIAVGWPLLVVISEIAVGGL